MGCFITVQATYKVIIMLAFRVITIIVVIIGLLVLPRSVDGARKFDIKAIDCHYQTDISAAIVTLTRRIQTYRDIEKTTSITSVCDVYHTVHPHL